MGDSLVGAMMTSRRQLFFRQGIAWSKRIRFF